MKTTKIITVIGLFILATMMIGSSTFAGSKLIASGQKPTALLPVTYVVHIHLDGIPNPVGINWIEMRDQNDQLIGHAQQFVPGVFTYVFVEYGVRVNSLRSAHFITPPNSNKLVWSTDVKAGPFFGGKTYLFTLFPIQ